MAQTREQYDAVIVGLGETGLACASHLVAMGCWVAVTDTRREPPAAERLRRDCPQVPCYTGDLDAALLASTNCVVVSPGVDTRLPAIAAARDAGIPVIGEIELFARAAGAPVVAITGSNGKSTVTSLVGDIMRLGGWQAAVGGNLGPPALSLLTDPEPDCYVLELSSFQLETVRSLDAAVVTVLNISPDHMDRYDSLADYVAAKQTIHRGSGTMVVNAQDPVVAGMTEPQRDRVYFGARPPLAAGDVGLTGAADDDWLTLGERPLLPVSALPLAGGHNTANAMAAVALGAAMGVSDQALIQGLRGFRSLPHRMEALGERRGLSWYNDSKGTNVGATVAAVSGLRQPFVLIAGGEGKDQSFEPMREIAGQARGVVVMGESAEAIAAAIGDLTPVARAQAMPEAVMRAMPLARAGDAVVLSPACASFDQYSDYTERGAAFRTAVEALDDA